MSIKEKYERMAETEKVLYLICWNHSGKMKNMLSLSTSVASNGNCRKNQQIEGSICQHCYAESLVNQRKTLKEKLELATDFLTSHIIEWEDIPYINALLFRFEAFGDLNNEIQVVNYFNIARKNSGTTFALWTKYPIAIKRAMDSYGIEKPANLIIIVSSPFCNYELKLETVQRNFPFVDKVFTVYEKEYIKENGVEINCGARHCFTCRKCYSKGNGVQYLREIKK